MEIQTFETEEKDTATGTTPEIEAEAVALIESLGLKGQKSLLTPKETGTERFQYPEMTAQEFTVYNAVFPTHTHAEEYGAGIIPVRVMQVIAHAKDFCTSVEVWHKEMVDPDPLLVGIKGKHAWEAGYKRFILARWGDAIKPFKDLILEARDAIIADMKHEGAEKVRQGNEQIATAEGIADKKLRGAFTQF